MTPRLLALLIVLLLATTLAAAPEASYPIAVASDGAGGLYVADLQLPGVYRIDPAGKRTILAKGGPAYRTPLRSPTALAVGKAGDLFVADGATSEVYRLRPGKIPEPLTGGALELPTGLAITPVGDLLVTDLRMNAILQIPATGGKPKLLARIPAPRAVTVMKDGAVVIISAGPDTLLRIEPDKKVHVLMKGRMFRFPHAIVDDGKGGVLVADGYQGKVWSVSLNGINETPWSGKPLVRPSGLALDGAKGWLVADPGAHQVFRVDPRGGPLKPLLAIP